MKHIAYHPRARATALTLIAVGTTSRGLAYIDAPDTSLTTFVDGLIPLHAWAIVWITAGLAVFAGIWSRWAARIAGMLAGSLWAVWSASFLLSWVLHILPWTEGGAPRGWVTGTALLTIAGLTCIVAYLVAHPSVRDHDYA